MCGKIKTYFLFVQRRRSAKPRPWHAPHFKMEAVKRLESNIPEDFAVNIDSKFGLYLTQ